MLGILKKSTTDSTRTSFGTNYHGLQEEDEEDVDHGTEVELEGRPIQLHRHHLRLDAVELIEAHPSTARGARGTWPTRREYADLRGSLIQYCTYRVYSSIKLGCATYMCV